jgi:hypothetical protein
MYYLCGVPRRKCEAHAFLQETDANHTNHKKKKKKKKKMEKKEQWRDMQF